MSAKYCLRLVVHFYILHAIDSTNKWRNSRRGQVFPYPEKGKGKPALSLLLPSANIHRGIFEGVLSIQNTAGNNKKNHNNLLKLLSKRTF